MTKEYAEFLKRTKIRLLMAIQHMGDDALRVVATWYQGLINQKVTKVIHLRGGN